MELKETYLRLWYKSVVLFLFCELEILLMCLFVCIVAGSFLFEGGLSNMAEGTIFGTVPLWFVSFAAFVPLSPFFAFAFLLCLYQESTIWNGARWILFL